MQKIKCECGRFLEVEEGVESVKCPACGRDVKVEAAEDWLSSVSIEEMSLEGGDVAAEPKEAEAAEAPKAEEPTPPPAGEIQLETPGRAVPSAQPTPGPPPLQPDAGPAVAEQPAEAAERQVGFLDLVTMARREPRDMLPYFEAGVKDYTFIATMAGLFVGLALVAGAAQTFAAAPRGFAVGRALGAWFSVICEGATAGIMLGLLCVAFKKDHSPLGVVEGLAFVRVAALAVMTPLYLIAGIVVLIATSGEGAGTEVLWLARHLSWVYFAVLLFAQTALITGLFRLGCLPSLILGVVVTFAGYSMAARLPQYLAGIFGG